MEQIRLDLKELKVESFVASDLGSSGEGTVFAMANTVCHATCNYEQDTCEGVGCSGYTDTTCTDYTDPQLVSCTGQYGPTELGCDTGACPTEVDCSHEPTECCGPTD